MPFFDIFNSYSLQYIAFNYTSKFLFLLILYNLYAVSIAPTPHIIAAAIYTYRIPYTKISSLPSIYPVTWYPILLPIRLYKSVVDNDIPKTIPKFLTKAFI